MQTLRKVCWGVFYLLLIVLSSYVYARLSSQSQAIQTYQLASPTIQQSDTLRIMSYNIAHGRGLADSNWDGGNESQRIQRLDNIAALLQKENADIIILNEVDFDASWSNQINQAKYLANAAGYTYVAEQRNLDFRVLFWTWRFGNAILSKHPILDTKLLDFPNYAKLETMLAGKKRGLAATIQVGDNKIQCMAVHLSHRSESLRAASAALLMADMSLPTVMAGDFNSAPSGYPISIKGDANENAIDLIDNSHLFSRMPAEPPNNADDYTFHASSPDRVIDWIFASKQFAFADYQVIKSTLSDHRPITATLVLNKKTKAASSAQ